MLVVAFGVFQRAACPREVPERVGALQYVLRSSNNAPRVKYGAQQPCLQVQDPRSAYENLRAELDAMRALSKHGMRRRYDNGPGRFTPSHWGAYNLIAVVLMIYIMMAVDLRRRPIFCKDYYFVFP